MAVLQSDTHLERSSESTASQNPGSSVSIEVAFESSTSSEDCDFFESSPAILEPSKVESCSQVWGRRCSTKDLHQNAERPSIVASGQLEIPVEKPAVPSVPQPEDYVDQMPNCCEAFCACYKDAAIRFWNSPFIHLMQILFSGIPVSAIIVGCLFLEKCPKAPYLPGLCAGIGIAGSLFLGIWITVSYVNRRGKAISSRQKLALAVFSVLLVLSSLVDAVLVLCLVPSTDPASTDYCDETFYTFDCYKEAATAVVAMFSAFLYALNCEDCSLGHSGRYSAF